MKETTVSRILLFWISLIAVILLPFLAEADTPAPGTVAIKGGSDGTVIGNVSDAEKVNVTNASIPVTGTFWQATQPVSGTLGRNWTLLNSTDSLTSFQGGTWSVGVNNFPSSFSVSNFPANQTVVQSLGSNLHVDIDNFPASQAVTGTFWQTTQPVSVASLPLPANAAQETGGNLATIVSNTTGLSTSANQTNGSQKTQRVDGSGNVAPAGDTSARATFVQTIYVTGSISNSTAITSTPTTFTAPSNAIGFILEAESTNTANIRWAVGSAASTTAGMLTEPGRDSGFVPLGANLSVAAVSGTQAVDIQWVSR